MSFPSVITPIICNNNEILAMTSGMNVCDNVFNLLVKWSLYLRVIVMCSEPLFIIIQLRVYRREETIRTRNVSAHSAQSISVSSNSAWQSRQSTRKQTHSTCSRWHFQFSHDTTSTISIQHRKRCENVRNRLLST